MKVGDLVRHPRSVSLTGECYAGIIMRAHDNRGGMILWEHGEICYSPYDELEVINGSR